MVVTSRARAQISQHSKALKTAQLTWATVYVLAYNNRDMARRAAATLQPKIQIVFPNPAALPLPTLEEYTDECPREASFRGAPSIRRGGSVDSGVGRAVCPDGSAFQAGGGQRQ